MIHTFITEIIKLKNNKMALTGFLLVIFTPVFDAVKTLFLLVPSDQWILNVALLLSMILPVMSGFFITQCLQREYAEATILNIITAPVSRTVFILSKTAVWFAWYLVTLMTAELVTIGCACILFGTRVDSAYILSAIRILSCPGLLSFVAFLPIIWIAVRQRSIFYPSMLLTLFFTVLQAAGNLTSPEMIKAASLLPWTAVSLTKMLPAGNPHYRICLISIGISGLAGILLSVTAFRKQDL